MRQSLIRALIASLVTGISVYLLVMRGAMPAIARGLTPTQIAWLRRAFLEHPWLVLASLAVVAAILALPVLLTFRLAFGPTKGQRRRSLR
jgi:hypothetical protein